jgi:hypothetical protein
MPNPGSDIDTIARIFRELYGDLGGGSTFGLDDITGAMIDRYNVTSQGALGKEALKRSTRPDRSRDPLYNQSKMYAEVYRVFGLITSTDSALTFRFSPLGEHLGIATDASGLLKECLLGIAYPNRAVEVKGDHHVRLFVCILRCMAASDGKISRDEIILGPMSMANDRNEREFGNLVKRLRNLRSIADGARKAIAELEGKIEIAANTMGNYTRIPIGALIWSGWATKQGGYFHLTDAGRSVLKSLEAARDLRIDDFDKLEAGVQAALIRVSFYEMLGRAGFDLDPVRAQVRTDRETLAQAGFAGERQLLFSPFQQLAAKSLSGAFHEVSSGVRRLQSTTVPATDPTRQPTVSRIELRESAAASPPSLSNVDEVHGILQAALKASGNDAVKAIEALHSKYETAGRREYYPLVTALFNIAGFPCEITRAGVNYARADATIILKDDTIPIEIKSPGEETEVSVKAVRQALENKIVFLSRKMFPCDPTTTTLVVGFNPPNSRSEVYELIDNIETCFGFFVGIFDFRNLVGMALAKLQTGLTMDVAELRAVRGLARVEVA